MIGAELRDASRQPDISKQPLAGLHGDGQRCGGARFAGAQRDRAIRAEHDAIEPQRGVAIKKSKGREQHKLGPKGLSESERGG